MNQTTKATRVPQAARRAAILDAAAKVFLDHGYAAASIDAVIERIGGSKRNIYSIFGSKEGLFNAIVEEKAEDLFNILSVQGDIRKEFQEKLFEFAVRLLEIFMSPQMAGVYRVVISEASRLPNLASSFYRNGPGRSAVALAGILDDAVRRGEIFVDDTKEAAEQFIGILRGNIYLEFVLGLREPLEPDEIVASARRAVRLFMNGVAVTSSRVPT
ncbi:TetR/AcrR family transcriptional regulator [Sinirhodobacter populi]|uniref:TetR/AcrR family transcriptional regulator n=1 Tax=Paenirhodobacter populi TaxID=2306993 RepID=A0A443JYE6_9RHOB|nr:TetR/AcrR family transcriptional regulator [Sinirhodobacter populi]RWR25504.1 TetR/AcrR family transcriptional regulator [Sinirhodobacter populi]